MATVTFPCRHPRMVVDVISFYADQDQGGNEVRNEDDPVTRPKPGAFDRYRVSSGLPDEVDRKIGREITDQSDLESGLVSQPTRVQAPVISFPQ